jgi:hypothetical protein
LQTVAFYKDHEGIVHLRGVADGKSGLPMFKLPPGYRPAIGTTLYTLVHANNASGAILLNIYGSTPNPIFDGTVVGGASELYLDAVSFPAES